MMTKHTVFTEQVKLEPFKRAMKEHKPDVWFTNLRKGQTAFRDSIDVVSVSKDGVIKVSPFYNITDEDLDTYLEETRLAKRIQIFRSNKGGKQQRMWFAYIKDMIMNQNTIQVDALESEAIYIFREVVAQFEKPVLLFSGGKDSITLVRLAQKAFYPAKIPFPLMHIDTGHNFPETIEFRDKLMQRIRC